MFNFRLKINKIAAEPLFQEKPLETPIEEVKTEIETKKEDTDTKPEEGIKEEKTDENIDEGGEDIGNVGIGFSGGDVGEEKPSTIPTTNAPIIEEKTPQEKLDDESRETVKKEIKRLKDLEEIDDPEIIKQELEDEGWEEGRLNEIWDLNEKQPKLEEVIRDAGSKRRIERIGKIINKK